jgi:hypothetical protein
MTHPAENDAPLPPCSCGTLADLGGVGPQHDRWCLRFRTFPIPPAETYCGAEMGEAREGECECLQCTPPEGGDQ